MLRKENREAHGRVPAYSLLSFDRFQCLGGDLAAFSRYLDPAVRSPRDHVRKFGAFAPVS